MIQAIGNMDEFYKNIHVDFIHQAISIPGVAMRVCFNSITDPAAEFHLFNPRNKDIYQLLKENIPLSFSIDTTKLIKPLFETIRKNLVRKSTAMTQMHFISGPYDKIFPLVIH